jgi:hypothetical protein
MVKKNAVRAFCAPPGDLYKQVLHAIEGVEIHSGIMHFPDGTKKTVERKTFGPDRWIERAKNRGILTPIQLLALIHFVIFEFGMSEEDEGRIVTHWFDALLRASECGDIVPRDLVSLLPLKTIPPNMDWIISLSDAEKFVASQGMEWTCAEIIEHLFAESFGAPQGGAGVARQGEPIQTSMRRTAAKEDWIKKAQAIAEGYLVEWRKAGYTPTVADAALYVEGVFSTQGTVNTRRELIDRETIKREALKGITGRKPGERVKGKKIPPEKREGLP